MVLSAVSGTMLSGYVDTSAIWLFGTGNTLYGRSFDGSAKQDGFNLNVVKLQLEKPLEEQEWSAGYTVGLLFGPDADTLASTSTLLPGATGTSGFAVENAYVSLRAPVGNGLDFKAGVWSSVVGYEVFESGSNPNYSRSFGYFIEPIIHTGILASYRFCDAFSVSAGIADRGDVNIINLRSGTESLKTYLGSFTFTAPEGAGFLEGATLTAGVCDDGLTARKDMINYYAGATLPTPVEGFNIGLAYDYRANGLFDSSYENAVSAYLTYQATEKLKLASRSEFASGSAAAGGGAGAFGVTAFPGKNVQLFGQTVTADYALWGNVVTRAEFRWDHSLTGQGLFNDGDDQNALSLAANIIYRF